MRRIVEAILETGPNMTEETRRELVEDYAALAGRYERWAWRAELLLGAPEIGPVRRLYRLLRLRLWRRGFGSRGPAWSVTEALRGVAHEDGIGDALPGTWAQASLGRGLYRCELRRGGRAREGPHGRLF